VVSPEQNSAFSVEFQIRKKTLAIRLLNEPIKQMGEGTETAMVSRGVPLREFPALDEFQYVEARMLYFIGGAAFAVLLIFIAIVAML